VVARDRGEAWHPESGQTLLDFEVGDLERAATELVSRAAALAGAAAAPNPGHPADLPNPLTRLNPLNPLNPLNTADAEDPIATAEEWYDQGVMLEEEQPRAAIDAYRRSLDLDPGLAAAHLNLGRLLHEAGDLPGAENHYRQAVTLRPDDALAAYNLGVALQDRRRPAEAVTAYETALSLDPGLADAHFNLSGLASPRASLSPERLGRRRRKASCGAPCRPCPPRPRPPCRPRHWLPYRRRSWPPLQPWPWPPWRR
jgi:tetratricopeptide (TPR) repeat protein